MGTTLWIETEQGLHDLWSFPFKVESDFKEFYDRIGAGLEDHLPESQLQQLADHFRLNLRPLSSITGREWELVPLPPDMPIDQRDAIEEGWRRYNQWYEAAWQDIDEFLAACRQWHSISTHWLLTICRLNWTNTTLTDGSLKILVN